MAIQTKWNSGFRAVAVSEREIRVWALFVSSFRVGKQHQILLANEKYQKPKRSIPRFLDNAVNDGFRCI